MRIIYGYSNCTDRLYKKIISERGASTMVPDQKYHSLLIKGLEKNGAEVRCYSGLPVNRAVTARKLIREKDEQEGNAHYHYITNLIYPGIRHLMIFCGAFFGVLKEKKDKSTFAVCDVLNVAAALGVACACKLRGIKKVAIVTDIPDMFDASGTHKGILNFVMRRFDGYVFLTEQMNDVANPKGAPHIVMEGHVDADAPAQTKHERTEAINGKKVVMYAGSIQKLYGITELAHGFIKADIPDCELRIYGHGDSQTELEALGEKYPALRYLGTLDNSGIVAEEQKASLLVNPRPTAPEYTKYSFPSKNTEYMVSGTPLLTTKLPGMPKEYRPYVYLIEDESAGGIADALKMVFSEPLEQRTRKGEQARDFVLQNKSNVIQAKRLMDFISENFGAK